MIWPLSKYFSFFEDTQPSQDETLPPSNRKRVCPPPRAPVILYVRLCLYSPADVKGSGLCYCFSRTEVPQIRDSRRRLTSCFVSRIAVPSCRLPAIVGSHLDTALRALWQEAWPPRGRVGGGEGRLAVNISGVVTDAGDVLCREWMLCLCVSVQECAQVGGIHVTHSCEKAYGLTVMCILCVAIRRKTGPYYMSSCCESTSDDAFEFLSPIVSFPSSIVSLSLCPILPLCSALSSIFLLSEEQHSLLFFLFFFSSVVHFCLVLFVEAQWSVTYWPLDRFQTTCCSCDYRIDVGAGTALLQITRSAFSV